MTATMQTTWAVPKAWPGERCFVICGGESVNKQRALIPRLRGRVIAVKQSAWLRRDADVMFVCGSDAARLCRDVFPVFTGTHIIARGKPNHDLPARTKRVGRTKVHTALCDDPTLLAGYDAGTSAINLAYHFGATEIVLLGYDMTGGRWLNGELAHDLPYPPQDHFRKHMVPLPDFAADAKRKGLRVANCSPISKVTVFEKAPLEAFL